MRVQAHQLLHGYRSGHGQIAASVRLADRDSDLITRLSDLSGSLSSGIQFDSYLTVYRLPNRKYFALARTWPDPKAPRAGCVLTHTLLIPIDYWEILSCVRQMDRLFQNPHSAPTHDFGAPLDLHAGMAGAPKNIDVNSVASEAFVSRYFGQGVRPLVWFNVDEPEEYLWRLLEHLWPKLRSAFACCTFSLQQRTLEDGPFDLLFAPSSVYSRFTKLSAEHLIEPAMDRAALGAKEAWCGYWANALFSSAQGLPSKENELPIWNELDEDPTAVRKLSLIHELRLRAKQSPTAGVGAMDVVESLARDPGTAVLLKRQVLTDAIDAAIAAPAAEDALTSLFLIDDRLHRESFREVAPDFEKRLLSAAAAIAMREPEAALHITGKWLTGNLSDGKGAFVDGVMTGLRQLARDNPSQLSILRSYPNVAAELFRLVPTFGAIYLHVGGDGAARVLADWLSSTQDMEAFRLVRKSVLSSLQRVDDQRLVSALLRDLEADDVQDTLSMLSKVGGGFSNQDILSVVTDRVSSIYPLLVRQWAAEFFDWSNGISQVVASTYPLNRYGFNELLDANAFSDTQRAQVITAMLREQFLSGFPYWLRELFSQDARLLEVLLFANFEASDYIEAILSRVLVEVPDLPLAASREMLNSILKFTSHPIFTQLLDSALRSAIRRFVSEDVNIDEMAEFLNHPSTTPWFSTIAGDHLAAILVRGCSSGSSAVARAWKWLADAPVSLYERRPSILPEICESLLSCLRRSFPNGVEGSLTRVLHRTRSEADIDARQALSGRMLRFALDNLRLPLGEVVAEAFADVYAVAIRDTRPPSFLASFFGAYDWDKGKDVRVSVVDAFLRSTWSPGELAIAANNAGILRKIFKRLHRTSRGDDYAMSMYKDLTRRNDPDLTKLAATLKSFLADPDFYEEWD